MSVCWLKELYNSSHGIFVHILRDHHGASFCINMTHDVSVDHAERAIVDMGNDESRFMPTSFLRHDLPLGLVLGKQKCAGGYRLGLALPPPTVLARVRRGCAFRKDAHSRGLGYSRLHHTRVEDPSAEFPLCNGTQTCATRQCCSYDFDGVIALQKRCKPAARQNEVFLQWAAGEELALILVSFGSDDAYHAKQLQGTLRSLGARFPHLPLLKIFFVNRGRRVASPFQQLANGYPLETCGGRGQIK